jgi:hypothetical protein
MDFYIVFKVGKSLVYRAGNPVLCCAGAFAIIMAVMSERRKDDEHNDC